MTALTKEQIDMLPLIFAELRTLLPSSGSKAKPIIEALDQLAATVIEQQRIITALSEDASKAAELARALQVVSSVLQSEITRSGGQPFTGRWSIPSIDWRGTVPEALDLADAALDAKP